MKAKNIFRIIIMTLFLLFISLYIIGNSSYYDYSATRKTKLTEEQIKEFEEKIAKGEKIDLNDYKNDENKYDNVISKTSLKLSNNIGKYVQKGLNFIFKKMESTLNQ